MLSSRALFSKFFFSKVALSAETLAGVEKPVKRGRLIFIPKVKVLSLSGKKDLSTRYKEVKRSIAWKIFSFYAFYSVFLG
jgi:hypothetical protein